MLLPANRLKDREEFTKVIRQGQNTAGQFLFVKFLNVPGELKFGFVVSKKISLKAVNRNRLKRQLREIIRLLILDNKLVSGYHVVVLPKSEALDKNFADLNKDLISVLTKANLLT